MSSEKNIFCFYYGKHNIIPMSGLGPLMCNDGGSGNPVVDDVCGSGGFGGVDTIVASTRMELLKEVKEVEVLVLTRIGLARLLL